MGAGTDVGGPSAPDLQPWPTDETGAALNLPCDNCGMTSIVILDTPYGCVAMPGKKRLNQCAQHLNNWGYLEGDGEGEIVLVSEISEGIARWAGW